ncbi:cation:proton antiporter [Acidothermaceae bacterium B102]|nr:cation:proton antiporter [Acidothermaceae bacterium B102]
MHGTTLPTLALVACAMALAPIVADLLRRVRLSGAVVEIVLGILIGPAVLAWGHPDSVVDTIAEIGLVFLIFLAGYEIDVPALRGRPLRLAATGWVVSLVLGLAGGLLLAGEGVSVKALVVGLALTTTALGTLLPIASDAGLLDGPLGPHLLAVGAAGEFGPIVAIALLLTGENAARTAVLLVVFALLAVGAALAARRPLPARLRHLMSHTLHTSGQLPVRVALLVVAALVWVASTFGLDILLGAFSAGMVVRLLVHSGEDQDDIHLVEGKLEAVGFGVFVPLFFVNSGMHFDLNALGHPATLVKVPLFLLAFLVVRGLPVLALYRGVLASKVRVALALMASTALPLVVVITDLGVATGQMTAADASALVGAGLLSVLLLPSVGVAIAARPADTMSR